MNGKNEICRVHFERLDSTQEFAKEKRGERRDLIVTASCQTGGKGTKGRSFSSEVGGVYLSKIGLSGNSLRKQIKKVHNVYFLDELGKTEATWIYEVEEFGPFFVAIDAQGNNYFEQLADDVSQRLPEIENELGIGQDYEFTEVNA